jgi:Ca-activated chloride channel homolog
MTNRAVLFPIILIVILSTLPVPAGSQGIHIESSLIAVPVIVSDSQGRYIPGLSADSFKLFQDGIPEPISLFLSADDPVKIALLLDTSKSATTVLKKIKSAARQFLLHMRPRDMAMIVSFDSDIRILCPFSSDRRELDEGIHKAESNGSQTKLREAIFNIQNRFQTISGRKAIVLLTDGDDHGSLVSNSELRDSVIASGVLIYSVFYNINLRELMRELIGVSLHKEATDPAWTERKEKSAQYLQEISELSAGRFYKSDVKEFDKAFKRISEELHSQYLLGFYPDNSKLDGNLHSLAVQVHAPGAVVRSRRSYRKAFTNDELRMTN